MIQIIYGAKGSGKTNQIVEDANNYAKLAKGVVVYLDRTNHRIHDLDNAIRLVDASYYELKTQSDLLSFIKGMLAANFDIERFYIDGLSRLLDCNVGELGEFYAGMEKLHNEQNVDFVLTASGAKEDLPDFVTKFIK